ncbi:unnamed protein product, partial [marine sediment metagenome]
ALTGLAAATWVPLIAVYSGLYPPKQAVYATSILSLSASIGRMLATNSTGFLNRLGGYSLAFYLAAAAAMVAIVIVVSTGKDEKKQKQISFASVFALFRRADVMLTSCVSLVAQIGNYAVTFGFLPILAQDLGANDVIKSLMVGLNLAVYTAANLMNTLIVKRVNHALVLYTGVLVTTGAITLIALSDRIALLFVGAALMGLANGFTYPTLMGLAIKDIDQSLRSSAMGIHQSIYAIGMFAGPWIGGILAEAMGIR